MSVPTETVEGRNDPAVTGRLATCPHCGMAAGVPLPRQSTRVESAEEADGTSPTLCPGCDTRFEVHYALE